MIRFCISFFAILALCYSAKLETRRYYHIHSFDGALVTIGGDNSNGVKVITEDDHGTDPRQTFWVGAGAESHEIQPQSQNTFSTLLLAIDIKSSLIFQKTRGWGGRHQWWMFHDLGGNSTYSVQNVRTGLCMTSKGKNTQLIGSICDRSSENQSWTFMEVQKRNN